MAGKAGPLKRFVMRRIIARPRMRADVLQRRMVSCGSATPDEDMQTPRDDRSLTPLLMERGQPGTALELSNHARLDGDLRAADSHVGIEALPISLQRKESASPDLHEAGALKEGRQSPDEPAVDRGRIRGCGNDATGESTIWMCEGRHIRIEVEDPKTPSRSQDSNQFRDGGLPPWDVGQHSRTHHGVKRAVGER